METERLASGVQCGKVLIVPCGMETRINPHPFGYLSCINCTLRNGNDTSVNESLNHPLVLIVPCGMETTGILDDKEMAARVLIVPCGMETTLQA